MFLLLTRYHYWSDNIICFLVRCGEGGWLYLCHDVVMPSRKTEPSYSTYISYCILSL